LALQRASDRLCDYFAVIGLDDVLRQLDDADKELKQERPDSASGGLDPFNTTFGASVLSRYPLDEEHEDTPFPLGVVLFCFPTGVKLVQPPPPDEPLPTFFTFVATGSAGVHMYGHCLTFYERLTPSQEACLAPVVPASSPESEAATGLSPDADATPLLPATPAPAAPFFAPKCLLILSRWCFMEFREFLTELYRLSLSESLIPLERIVCNFLSGAPHHVACMRASSCVLLVLLTCQPAFYLFCFNWRLLAYIGMRLAD
jgi:hypothetical protein